MSSERQCRPPSRAAVVVFGLYGTLLDPASVPGRIAGRYGGERAEALVALWTRYRREYAWRCNGTEPIRPYDELTRSALKQAACELGISFQTSDAEALITSCGAMATFPDVERAMELIAGKDRGELEIFVFTNASATTATSDMQRSPGLVAHLPRFRDIYSAASAGCYMPAGRAYDHLKQILLQVSFPRYLWMVSTEPADIVGAKARGWQTVFVDRAGRGWVDRLDEANAPSLIVSGTDEAVKAIMEKEATQ